MLKLNARIKKSTSKVTEQAVAVSFLLPETQEKSIGKGVLYLPISVYCSCFLLTFVLPLLFDKKVGNGPGVKTIKAKVMPTSNKSQPSKLKKINRGYVHVYDLFLRLLSVCFELCVKTLHILYMFCGIMT